MSNQKYTTEVVRKILEEEGWEFVREELQGRKTRILIIKNPEKFYGLECKISLNRIVNGYRPTVQSLVDGASYFSKLIAEDGWELISEYNGTAKKVIVRNPDIFNGYDCHSRPNHWKRGIRPGIESLVDPTSYLAEEFLREGWVLLNEYKGARETLYIKNENFFGGSVCQTSYIRWFTCGNRVDMSNVVNPYDYVNSLLINYGYRLKEDWVYEGSIKRFGVIELKSGREYSTNWSSILIGNLPNSAQFKIRNALSNHLRLRNVKRDFKLSEIFSQEYWKEFDRKFPSIDADESLDHILPMSFFGNCWSQMKLANEVRNLRLLPMKENAGRGNRVKASELDEYNLWDLYYRAENPKGYSLIEDRYDLAS